jgi:type II secretion system protein J
VTAPGSSFPVSRRAFTLLEVIIATAVGAIVLLVVNATFFGALRLHHTTHDRLAADQALQRALGIVRRDLAGVMLPAHTFAGPLQTTLAGALRAGTYGDKLGPDLYTNTGAVDGWTPFAEVQLVDYYLAPAADGSQTRDLVRAVTRNLLPAEITPPETQTLLTGVAEAAMDFHDGTGWTAAWDSAATGTLPTAIRFQVVLAATAPGAAPADPFTLIVPVLVTPAASAATAAGAAAP